MVEYEDYMEEAGRQLHHFYCDRCGKDLGTSLEHDDGWCEDPKDVHCAGINWLYNGSWYKLRGEFCEDCVNKIDKEVYEFFDKMGIEKEYY